MGLSGLNTLLIQYWSIVLRNTATEISDIYYFAKILFLNSSKKKITSIKIKSIPHSFHPIPIVLKICWKEGTYTRAHVNTSSKRIPQKMSLFPQNPILKTDRVSLRHAKTFAICITTIPTKTTVIAFKWSGLRKVVSFGSSCIPGLHPP